MWRGQVKEEDRAESERETDKNKEDVESTSERERESERGESAKERLRSEEEKKLSIRLFSSLKRGVPFYILPGFQG
jgi:hypothetical protein